MATKTIMLPVRTTKRNQMIDVTSELQQVVQQSGIHDGMVVAQVMHTTAALTINENADPDVVRDMLAQLEKMVPENGDYNHSEGNSDAHVKSSMIGASITVLIENKCLLLGTWQGLYFCEFDGPRQRKIAVRIIGD